jgi:hypothetical protein
MPAEIVIHKCVPPGSRFAGSLRSRADLPQNLSSNENPPVSSHTGSTTGSNWFEHSFRLWSGHLFDPERVSRPGPVPVRLCAAARAGDDLRSEHFAVKPRRSHPTDFSPCPTAPTSPLTGIGPGSSTTPSRGRRRQGLPRRGPRPWVGVHTDRPGPRTDATRPVLTVAPDERIDPAQTRGGSP